MFKQRTTNKNAKIKTEKTNCVKYCFYYIYRAFFLKSFSFLHKIFYKNEHTLNTKNKKTRLSQYKLLRSFKTSALPQH